MAGQLRRPLAVTGTALKAQSVGKSLGATDDEYPRIRSPTTRAGHGVFAVFHFADLQLEFPTAACIGTGYGHLNDTQPREQLAFPGDPGGARLSPNQSPSACAKVSGDRLDRACIPESSPPNRRPVCVNGSVPGIRAKPASLPIMDRARQILCVPAGRVMM
jgi:hypothetical protein